MIGKFHWFVVNGDNDSFQILTQNKKQNKSENSKTKPKVMSTQKLIIPKLNVRNPYAVSIQEKTKIREQFASIIDRVNAEKILYIGKPVTETVAAFKNLGFEPIIREDGLKGGRTSYNNSKYIIIFHDKNNITTKIIYL